MNPDDFVRQIYPRLVVVVTSIDKQGTSNAAPYSWVCPVSFSPPMLLVGIQNRETLTVRNIRATKEFVVNIVTKDWAEQAIACEAKVKAAENKLEKAGLETIESKKVKAPTIKKAKIALECRLSEIIAPAKADHLLVIGEIVSAKSSNPRLEEILMHLLGEKFCTPRKEFVLRRKR